MTTSSWIRKTAARYVNDIEIPLTDDSVSIIIIEREKLGGYSVHTVTDISLDDTRTLRSLTELQHTYGRGQAG